MNSFFQFVKPHRIGGAILALALFVARATGAPLGSIDETFNPQLPPGSLTLRSFALPDGRLLRSDANGLEWINQDGSSGGFLSGSAGLTVRTIAIQPDQKIIISTFSPSTGSSDSIRRLNPDGSLDTSFLNYNLAGLAYQISAQADGKIVLVGSFRSERSISILRLNSDGSWDSTFLTTGVEVTWDNPVNLPVPKPVYFALPLSGGRVLVGGNFASVNEVISPTLAVLNADGSFHSNPSAGLSSAGTAFPLPDGGFRIAGTARLSGDSASWTYRLADLDSNLVLKTSLTLAMPANLQPFDLLRQWDGKMLAACEQQRASAESPRKGVILRFFEDGGVETSFPFIPFDIARYGYLPVMELTPDRKLMLAGAFTMANDSSRSNLVRIHLEGPATADPPSVIAQPRSVSVFVGREIRLSVEVKSNAEPSYQWQRNGQNLEGQTNRALVVKSAQIANEGAYRVMVTNPHGSITSSEASVTVITPAGALKPDFANKLAVQGRFQPGAFFGLNVRSLAQQSDGRILIAGAFTNAGGILRAGIARAENDGSLDASFVPPSDLIDPSNPSNIGTISTLALDSQERIVVGGFSGSGFRPDATPPPANRASIKRLLSNGALDSSFNPGAGASNHLSALAILANGSILAGYACMTNTLDETFSLAQLLNDSGYPMPTSFPTWRRTAYDFLVRQIVPLPGNRALMGGNFDFHGHAALQSTGALDINFSRRIERIGPFGVPDPILITALAVQPDGKIIIAGEFASVNFQTRIGIARLRPNGTVDPSFNPGDGLGSREVRYGTGGHILALAVQPDGRILWDPLESTCRHASLSIL